MKAIIPVVMRVTQRDRLSRGTLRDFGLADFDPAADRRPIVTPTARPLEQLHQTITISSVAGRLWPDDRYSAPRIKACARGGIGSTRLSVWSSAATTKPASALVMPGKNGSPSTERPSCSVTGNGSRGKRT